MLGIAVQKTEKKKQINKNKVVFCLLNLFFSDIPAAVFEFGKDQCIGDV